MTRNNEDQMDAFFSALASGVAEDPISRRQVLREAGLDYGEVERDGLGLVERLRLEQLQVLARMQELSIESVPVKELAKRGWIKRIRDGAAQLAEILRFFGANSVAQWQLQCARTAVQFRKSVHVDADPAAVAAWLRIGVLLADRIECAPYNRDAFMDALHELRKLTVQEPEHYLTAIADRCSSAGVAVVFVAALPNTGISGATRWLTLEKAIIQLSCRYRSDDHFWFTFYHEAAHVVFHGRNEIFVECLEQTGDDQDLREMEANDFATDFLVPIERMSRFLATGNFTRRSVESFAQAIGIAPGIVVGQLQKREKLGWDRLNGLKKKVMLDA
ncbi:ImmA/IrrE family metallo-endopeptidase [Longimicrobium sp.]|uniref:ImmA/IrrE family metallo-endopeptidase n=1 Tax=Longimicrobium sp. TaxID=2029185 RepID=UPI002C7FAF21|nr:ImmA/IrrE family metallo-endopeptidase [Longimicrobium sp.]HSU13520.1 ImmA/IrrE family metallo-endopeptidase [Longimicrobium sp.]